MKIIDNKKDLYDYLSGIYGIDDLVVYDRRGSISGRDIISENSIFFDKRTYDKENGFLYSPVYYDEPIHSFNPEYKKYYSLSTFRIVVEAGNNHMYIDVKRYRLKKEDPVTIEFNAMSEDDYWKMRKSQHVNFRWMINSLAEDEVKARKKFSKAPLAIAFYYSSDNNWNRRNKPTIYDNPILQDIPGVSGKIDPIWVWQSIYDYISSQKDKPIVDNRTNDEHIESAGFDKKTSFRNIK